MKINSLTLIVFLLSFNSLFGYSAPNYELIGADTHETPLKVHNVSRFANLKKILSKPNVKFIIRYNHKLRGKTIQVGENSMLDFQGGSLKGGTLVLNNNVVITGTPVFYYSCTKTDSDTEFAGYTYQNGICLFRAPVIVKDKSNVVIENAHFIMETQRESVKWHGAIICYGEKECSNIRIINCRFEGGKVAFYSNVHDSEIRDCTFLNMEFTAIAVETAYDHTPWRHPKNISIIGNTIEQSYEAVGETGNVIWCSGVEDLNIENNQLKILQSIMLYCGDGNVILKNVNVSNNKISLLTGYDGMLKNMAAIILMGKSYPYLSEIMPEQSVRIKDNYLKCDNVGHKDTSIIDNAGISMLFSSNVTVENNYIYGFSIGVDAGDHFRGKYYHVNGIKIYNNTFDNIVNTAINVDCEPQFFEVINNDFITSSFKTKETSINNSIIRNKTGAEILVRKNTIH